MEFVLVPRYVSAREGSPTSVGGEEVWIGAFGDSPSDDPSRQEVDLVTATDRVRISQWTQPLEKQPIWYATYPMPPGKGDQEVKLITGSKEVSSATVSLMPRELGQEPFRVLLGSCFDPGVSRSSRLKEMVDRLPGPVPLKILCGDQVYLDPLPPVSFFSSFRSPEAKAAYIYRRTWTHPGFSGLLARGLNVFCPDDHDFWDNYTVEAGARQGRRARAAKALLDAFQGVPPVQTFNVAPLRFMIVDTRQFRTEPKTEPTSPPPQFVDEAVLDRVVEWVGQNDGPGVLVLGQPIFGEEGYREGSHGSDIPQYTRQFGRLAEALVNAPCSIVILSGDVHWARIAYGTNLKQKSLVEVISSPLAMSSARSLGGWVRPWKKARSPFGSPGCPIETRLESKLTAPHFVTVDFSLPGNGAEGVNMKVKAWPVREPPPESDEKLTFRCTI